MIDWIARAIYTANVRCGLDDMLSAEHVEWSVLADASKDAYRSAARIFIRRLFGFGSTQPTIEQSINKWWKNHVVVKPSTPEHSDFLKSMEKEFRKLTKKPQPRPK